MQLLKTVSSCVLLAPLSLWSRDAVLPWVVQLSSQVNPLSEFPHTHPEVGIPYRQSWAPSNSTIEITSQKTFHWSLVHNVYEGLCCLLQRLWDYKRHSSCYSTQTQLYLYFYKDLFLITVYECLTCMYVMYTTPIPGAWGDPKRTLDLLELELWMIESWTLSLCKSHQCSIQLSHLSSF